MLGLPSRASCWAITAAVVLTAAILTRCAGRVPKLGEWRELDPGLLERPADRERDVRGVGCVAVHADALDLELELPSVDGDHRAVPGEADCPLAHLLRVA